MKSSSLLTLSLSLLLFSQFNCYLINKGAREFNVFLPAGVVLVIIGTRMFMNIAGKTDRHAAKRFLYGIISGISIFLG